MKNIFFLILTVIVLGSCKEKQKLASNTTFENKAITAVAQKSREVVIDSVTIRRHLYTLAADDMEGRKPGTPGIEKAAQYIEGEFKRIGLKTYNGSPDFRQNFEHKNIKMFNVIGVLEGKSKKDEYVICLLYTSPSPRD